MTCRIKSIEIVTYPVLKLTFDDGLSGELDLSKDIAKGPVFTPLEDRAFFQKVQLAEDGRSFGWKLDEVGGEIDFGADAARNDVETALVEARANRFRARVSHAAE